MSDRRGEAHLWLVLEEALDDARRGGGVDDVRLRFRTAVEALVVVGAIESDRGEGIAGELDDALGMRGLVPAGSFRGRPLPVWDRDGRPPRRQGDDWLETQIEHHLDLIADLDPSRYPGTGRRVLELLRPAARALEAAGSLAHGERRLADLAATLRAAGYDVPAPLGEIDKGWLAFLRDRPASLLGSHQPASERRMSVVLGAIAGSDVAVRRIGWSEALLEIEVTAPDTYSAGRGGGTWRCSAFDNRGHLHVGQPGLRRHDFEDAPLQFRLRPGLMAGVSSLVVRVSHGADRLEEQIELTP